MSRQKDRTTEARATLPGSTGRAESPPASRVEGKKPGGRPPKFNGPSRPVTLTLPETILKTLRHFDPDRARAIVKATEAAASGGKPRSPGVEVVEMMAGKGLLVVGPCEALRRIPFLHLVEVAPLRFILALDSGHDFKMLELSIRDVLDELPEDRDEERALITELLQKIGGLRKADRVRMAEILLVQMSAPKTRLKRKARD